MDKTPTKIPTKRQITPRKTPKKAPSVTSFADVDTPVSSRILRLNNAQIPNFKGLKNYSNLRVLDLRNNNVQFDKLVTLIAFRALYLTNLNGEKISQDDISETFKYSGIVTHALREGLDPSLAQCSPEEALENSIKFLGFENSEEKYTADVENNTVKITTKADLYSWYYLDENMVWTHIDWNEANLTNPRLTPLRCTTYLDKILIPEYDNQYHVYGELLGDAREGGVLSIKTQLSNYVQWVNTDQNDEVLAKDCLVLPLTPNEVNCRIACDITPLPGLPVTRLLSPPVRPGEFRFRSLRMQGTMIEDDDIEFDVSTSGTNAVFKGVRILRSARYGEWENVTTLEADNLVYKLTVHDIGCVIRAICLTEGGGPPLMLTSAERVQPSPPSFTNPMISGTGLVGTPLFAIATYKGGIQGMCKYQWNIGNENDRNRPVIVPREEDLNKKVQCKMTPIRSDGSIGNTVVAEFPSIKPSKGDGLVERFVSIKPTKNNPSRLHIDFTKQRNDQLVFIKEGKTVVAPQQVDWAVVTSEMIHSCGHGQDFQCPPDLVNGIIVLFTNDYFALIGQITAADPSADNVIIQFERNTSVLSVSYDYYGGIEGRTIIQWNRKPNTQDGRDQPVAFGKVYHINLDEASAYFRAIVTPVSIDGKKGKPVSSETLLIKKTDVNDEDDIPLTLTYEDEDLQENDLVVIATEDEEIPEGSRRVLANRKLTNYQKAMWERGKNLLAEGIALRVSVEDVNQDITCRVINRLTGKTEAQIALPTVSPLTPTIQGIRLSVQTGKQASDGRQIVVLTVDYSNYVGGFEGNPTIIWKVRKDGETEFTTVAKTQKKSIDVDHFNAANSEFYATVTPKDSDGNKGEPIDTNHVIIPPFDTSLILDIQSAQIVINEDHTALHCVVQTNGQDGTLYYQWGYLDDGREDILEEETSDTKEITIEDFEYAVFCKVTPVTAHGIQGETALVYLPVNLEELFVPKITNVRINIANDPKDHKLVVGDTLCCFIEKEGPPIAEQHIIWERYQDNQWTQISTNLTYDTNANDLNCKLRARVTIQVEDPYKEELVSSEEFTTTPIVLPQNPTIAKLAIALKRSKAQFDAKLAVTGEDVSILLENGFFLMRNSKAALLLRDRVSNIKESIIVNPDNESEYLVQIKAHHGYSTLILFDKKKMNGGTKLSPSLARELFIETLRKFKQ